MATRRIDPSKDSIKVAEAFALAHLLVTNIIVVLGEFTDIFYQYGASHGGVKFVTTLIDGPVYQLFEGRILGTTDELMYFVWTEVVIVLSSVLYGFFCYIFARVTFSLFRL